MSLPAQTKDSFYKLLKEPSLESFREFLQDSTGEHNYIDFKESYISGPKLAKELLSIANYGGGAIVFGVKQYEDNTFSCDGLSKLKDKAEISKQISKYIPSSLNYDVYDFLYDSSEYEALVGKSFQIIIIDDSPKDLPFLSKRDGEGIYAGRFYTRRGTECVEADNDEISLIVSRRVNYAHPNSGKPLELNTHLDQLKELYAHLNKVNVRYEGGIGETLSIAMRTALSSVRIEEENPAYPEESYDEFISKMIELKKNKIERFLDLS